MNKLINLSLLLTLALQTQSIAEEPKIYNYNEESRIGWYGGIGAGAHTTSFTLDSASNIESKSSFATSVKIGYNFTEQLSVGYVRNASWYTINNDTFVSGITGISATYYFLPQQQTWYASIAAGIGDFANLDEKSSDTGGAFMATVGYEFAPHWQAEASYMMTSITDSYNDTLTTSSLQAFINYSWY